MDPAAWPRRRATPCTATWLLAGPSVSVPARVSFEQQDHSLGAARPAQRSRAHLVAHRAAATVDAVEPQLLAAVVRLQASAERLAQLSDRQPDVEIEERPAYRLLAAQPPQVFRLLVPEFDL